MQFGYQLPQPFGHQVPTLAVSAVPVTAGAVLPSLVRCPCDGPALRGFSIHVTSRACFATDRYRDALTEQTNADGRCCRSNVCHSFTISEYPQHDHGKKVATVETSGVSLRRSAFEQTDARTWFSCHVGRRQLIGRSRANGSTPEISTKSLRLGRSSLDVCWSRNGM